jgi:hypothetical protein
MAEALVMLRRYREAIPLFEQLLPALHAESLTSAWLAQAYLGVGDERNARRVLQMSRLSGNRLDTKVAELRGIVSRR